MHTYNSAEQKDQWLAFTPYLLIPSKNPHHHHTFPVTYLCTRPDLFRIDGGRVAFSFSPPDFPAHFFLAPTPVHRASFSPLPCSPPSLGWLYCSPPHHLLLSFFPSLAADHQRSPTPPPTACGSQTTSPACLCLTSLSLPLSLSTLSFYPVYILPSSSSSSSSHYGDTRPVQRQAHAGQQGV